MSRQLALADPLMRDGEVPDHGRKDVTYAQRLLSGDPRVAKGGFGEFHPGDVDGEWAVSVGPRSAPSAPRASTRSRWTASWAMACAAS